MDLTRPTTISGTRLRRAVVGVLLVARQPQSIDDVLRGLRSRGLTPPDGQQRTRRKIVADVLRYQATLGRVRRLERGVYEVVPGALSRSMRDRCVRALSGGGSVEPDERRGGEAVLASDG
jgi:hypothetical protein